MCYNNRAMQVSPSLPGETDCRVEGEGENSRRIFIQILLSIPPALHMRVGERWEDFLFPLTKNVTYYYFTFWTLQKAHTWSAVLSNTTHLLYLFIIMSLKWYPNNILTVVTVVLKLCIPSMKAKMIYQCCWFFVSCAAESNSSSTACYTNSFGMWYLITHPARIQANKYKPNIKTKYR